MIEAGELGEIHHFRGRYLQDWGDDRRRRLALRHATRRAPARSATSARTSIDLARYLVGEIDAVSALDARRSSPGREVDDAFEAAVEFENGAVGTIEATRFAAGRKNALQLGDQRLEGLARVRPGAAERAAGHSRGRRTRASGPCSSPRPTTRSGSGGGRRATSSAGSTPSCTSSHHLLERDRGRHDVAPHGATFEDGYRAAEVCDAILRSAESPALETITYR